MLADTPRGQTNWTFQSTSATRIRPLGCASLLRTSHGLMASLTRLCTSRNQWRPILRALPPQAQQQFVNQLMPLFEMLGQLSRAEQLATLTGSTASQRVLLTRVATANVGVAVTSDYRAKLRSPLARYYPDADGARNIGSVLIDARSPDVGPARPRTREPPTNCSPTALSQPPSRPTRPRGRAARVRPSGISSAP